MTTLTSMTKDEGIVADDSEARAEVAADATKEILDRAEAAAAEAQATRELCDAGAREAKAALDEAFTRGASKVDLARHRARQLTAESELRAALKASERANDDLAAAGEDHKQARKNVVSFALQCRSAALSERLEPEYVRNAELIMGTLVVSCRLASEVTKANERMSRSLPVPNALISPDFLCGLRLVRSKNDPLRPKFGGYWSRQSDPSPLAEYPLSAIVVPIESPALHSARNSVDEWIGARDKIRDAQMRLISLYETAAQAIAELLISEARLRWDSDRGSFIDGFAFDPIFLPRPGSREHPIFWLVSAEHAPRSDGRRGVSGAPGGARGRALSSLAAWLGALRPATPAPPAAPFPREAFQVMLDRLLELAHAAGTNEERQRIAGIMRAPGADTNQAFALHIALNIELKVDAAAEAITIQRLASAPAATVLRQ